MSNQTKLTTIVFTILLTLAFAVPAIPVSAFDSPVPTPERTPAPPPPRPTPPDYIAPSRSHKHETHQSGSAQVLLASEPDSTIDWQGLGFIVAP